MRRTWVPLALIVVLASGCLATHPAVAPPAAEPAFRPEVFFLGHTSGIGTLTFRNGFPKRVRVQSVGTPLADGTFQLDQTITLAGEAPEDRTWIMRPQSPTRYTASLTDATGEAEITVEGSLLRIRYLLAKPDIRMEQRLYLEPDGQAALNLATVRFLGIPIARLQERITRGPSPPER